MSVMIKGMEMPKSCHDCDLFSGEGFLCPLVIETTNDWTREFMYKRVDECPLVEIPTSYGRLIDADNLVKVLQNTLDNYPDNYNDEKTVEKLIVTVCKRYIEHAPTVIEAEVSE